MATTHSTSKRSLKSSYVRNLGTPSEQTALMVKITWTQAAIVPVEFTKNAQITTFTVSISKKDGYKVVSTQKINVQAGMKFYFVKSSESGLYYMVKWSESFQQFACSCPAGRMKHSCKHITMVNGYVDAREELVAVEAEVISVEELQAIIAVAEEWKQQKEASQAQHQAEIDASATCPNYEESQNAWLAERKVG